MEQHGHGINPRRFLSIKTFKTDVYELQDILYDNYDENMTCKGSNNQYGCWISLFNYDYLHTS